MTASACATVIPTVNNNAIRYFILDPYIGGKDCVGPAGLPLTVVAGVVLKVGADEAEPNAGAAVDPNPLEVAGAVPPNPPDVPPPNPPPLKLLVEPDPNPPDVPPPNAEPPDVPPPNPPPLKLLVEPDPNPPD